MEINKVFNEKVSIIFLILFCMLFYNRLLARDYLNETEPSIEDLWLKTVGIMLNEPLWKKRDAYDTGHYLMIPLHTAFKLNDKEKIKKFKQFFLSFSKSYYRDKFNSIGNLNKLHFLYLVSQYLHLSKKNNFILNQKLINIVKEQLEKIWKEPAWQWGQKPFPKGINERINWKLNVEEVKYSFFRAIIDEEFFSFAIAADLAYILQKNRPYFITAILDLAYLVFRQCITFIGEKEERWLFQPGVRADHPSYAYSGNHKIKKNISKKLVKNIASDTSHFHRFPLWLNSLIEVSKVDNKANRTNYYLKLKRGLTKQFLNHVLITPDKDFPNYRTTNFMDGYNGIFRYNYQTQGIGNGYAPHELSGTILIGWWSFLNDEKIKEMYCYIASRFPLTNQEISVYLGPDTTRERHPLIKGKSKYKNGLVELICAQAAAMLHIYVAHVEVGCVREK